MLRGTTWLALLLSVIVAGWSIQLSTMCAIAQESEMEPAESQEQTASDKSGADIKFLHDVEYGHPNGHPLHMEIAIPATRGDTKATPAVLYFHPGGFVQGTHKKSPIALIAKHGFLGASVEYRFSNEAPFPAQLQDAQLAIRWLRANATKYNVDPSRIAVWGASAGATLSQWLGTFRHSDGIAKAGGYEDLDDSVQAVCSFFGSCDYTLPYRINKQMPLQKNVEQLLGCTYKDNPDRFKQCSAITHVRPDDPPFFIVNGMLDKIVIPEQGMEMNKALAKAGVAHRLILVKNAGHLYQAPPGTPAPDPNPNEVRQDAFAFLDKYLAQSGTTSGVTAKPAEDSVSSESTSEEKNGDAAANYPFQLVKIPSGKFTIYGALWKPEGNGPFPAMIYNHGSDPRVALVAGAQKGYGNLGPFYVKHGFVFLIPLRRGHEFGFNLKAICKSDGALFGDRVNSQVGQGADSHKRNMEFIHQQEVDNLDVEAAVDWLKQQPFVDPNKLVMSGISFGGIQTTLAAEKGMGVKAFIPFAPAAMSWQGIPELHERLKKAMQNAAAPVFLIQAQNDFNTGPSEYLGPVLDKKGAPNRHKLYPEFVPEQGHRAGHGGFATWPAGIAIWSPDVMPFINQAIGEK